MNVSSKFEINWLSHLSRNVWKPQNCDRQMDVQMDGQADSYSLQCLKLSKKIEEKSTKSFQSSSKVVSLGLADLR